MLQFIGLIDDQGKRTDDGHAVMTRHDEADFRSAFEPFVKSAYSDLFNLRGDDAWTMSKDQLISYFRSADKTSDIIGGRQAGVFIALRDLAGHQTEIAAVGKPKAHSAGKAKTSPKKAKLAEQKRPPDEGVQNLEAQPVNQPKGGVALTVRVEINLPAEGTQETYDAIFKSIKANLLP